MSKFVGKNENPDIPIWMAKNSKYNLNTLSPELRTYFNELPAQLQERVVITSYNTGKHADKSRHYKNAALDLRYDETLFNHFAYDQSRPERNIVLLDPNHGTGKHIHISHGVGSENKHDVLYKPTKTTSPDFEYDDMDEVEGVMTPRVPMAENSFMQEYISTLEKQNEEYTKLQQKQAQTPKRSGLKEKTQSALALLKDLNLEQVTAERTTFSEGGWISGDPKKPIFVTDKNDPKLKAYNDSLTVYKGGQEAQKYFNSKIEPLLKVDNKIEASSLWSAPVTGYVHKDSPSFDKAFDRLKKLNGKYPSPQVRITSKYDDEFGVYGFKKPVQPIVHKKDTYENDLKLYNENKKAYESETGLSYDELVYDAIKKGNKSNSSIGWTEKNVELFAYRKPVLMTKNEPKKPEVTKVPDIVPLTTPPEVTSKSELPIVEPKTTVPIKSIGKINIHGRDIIFTSEEHKKAVLSKLSVYKPIKVGDSENYIVSRFGEKTKGWQGAVLLDENGREINLNEI